jgi:hypothetical protein
VSQLLVPRAAHVPNWYRRHPKCLQFTLNDDVPHLQMVDNDSFDASILQQHQSTNSLEMMRATVDDADDDNKHCINQS